MKILVTGNAGFIGFHMVNLLLKKKISVVGIDSINNYYDVNLKKKRLDQTKKIARKYKSNYRFYKLDLCEQNKLKSYVQIHCLVRAAYTFVLNSNSFRLQIKPSNQNIQMQKQTIAYQNSTQRDRH